MSEPTPGAADRFELGVGEIPPAAVAWGFPSRITGFFSGDLKLVHESAEEIREKDLAHQDLLHRHGLQRVLAFYEGELLPAVTRLPAGTKLWRLWFRLGCRV